MQQPGGENKQKNNGKKQWNIREELGKRNNEKHMGKQDKQ